MFVLDGEKVSDGTAIGRIYFYKRESYSVQKRQIQDVDTEVKRLEEAKEVAVGELQVLYEQSIPKIGQNNALVFGAHQMILEDSEFWQSVIDMVVDECVNAEYAVWMISQKMEDKLRRQKRAEDMKDVSERLIRILSKQEFVAWKEDVPSILVVNDLLPSEAVRLNPKNILGIVMVGGTPTSHASIFAKAMGIPAIIAMDKLLQEEWEDTLAILDGRAGKLYLQPEGEIVERMRRQQEEEQCAHQQKKIFAGKRTKICVCANVGSDKEIELALENGADGLGLVRSEIFCLNQGKLLTEEEQFCIYKKIVEQTRGKRVVIRTWDIGGDKKVEGLTREAEENPALGLRGIRLCLAKPEIFKSQLRAIFRASAYGKLAIMFPMITSSEEVRKIKAILEEVKGELRRSKLPFDESVTIGAMLETPAAVMVSCELAKELDFFSLGTNDLIQYTLAMDRQNADLNVCYDPGHPAIWEMIRMAIKQVHTEGKQISICGELGADTRFIKELVKMGIDEFSVVPSAIPTVREMILEME